jgi:hypothetical protein
LLLAVAGSISAQCGGWDTTPRYRSVPSQCS